MRRQRDGRSSTALSRGVSAPPGDKFRKLLRLASDPLYRSVKYQSWFGRRGLFQPVNDTAADRYPRIFSFLADALSARRDIRILSFGCSTGEEVFTLARYFPTASIKGLDINPVNIVHARKRLEVAPDPRLTFAVAGDAESEPEAHYDAVLCMAVFRDGRLNHGPQTCTRHLRFAAFERALAGLDRTLKPQGLLAMRHSNFRLCDSALGPQYHTILGVPYAEAKHPPIYGADERLKPGQAYPDCVFRKAAAPTGGPGRS